MGTAVTDVRTSPRLDAGTLAALAADLFVATATPTDGALDAALATLARLTGATRAELVDATAAPGDVVVPLGSTGQSVRLVGLPSAPDPEWLAAAGTVLGAALDARTTVAALAWSEELHRTVLDDVGSVVVKLDATGRISYLNAAWSQLTGIPVAEMIGKDPLYHVHPEDREVAAAHMADGLRGNESEVRAVRFRGPGGQERWMEVGGRVVRNEAGIPVGMVGIMHDVTERHQAAQHANVALDRAERARENAERASEAKSEFLSRMSHELRTPLNAILGFAQLMELAPLDGEDADNLTQITRAGRHLLMLVNDALDVSRIEAGQLALDLVPLPAWPALAESLDQIRPAAAARSLVVAPLPVNPPDLRVQADPNRLRQVLANLLSNAVKYNVPGGRIQLDCRPLEEASGARIRIAVSDTGVGIAAGRMDEVFLPFQRLGAETSGIEGTGLGLAVTKSLVEAMGGTIGVGSVEGVGTTFYVDLPAA
jgi:PAS domain S-box-containing protein